MSTRRVTTHAATGLVVSRELHEAFRRRSLWIIFAVLFAGSCAAMVLPDLLGGGKSRYDVAVVSRHGREATAFEDASDADRARAGGNGSLPTRSTTRPAPRGDR